MNEVVFAPCALVPVYNHFLMLGETVADLLDRGLPVILVDDGSDAPGREVIAEVAGWDGVTLVRRPINGGKGAAVKDGLRCAMRLGYTHAVQIDADGQHNRQDVVRFLGAARKAPDTLVCGYPEYDDSIPKNRLYGRYATHIWVWINTLSFDIRDSMCGFRIYPVEASCRLLECSKMGDRMDFDVEFIVRWHWSGLGLAQLPTVVTYPGDGISHFRLWRDNVLISRMHARLFFGMLKRIPRLLNRSRRRVLSGNV